MTTPAINKDDQLFTQERRLMKVRHRLQQFFFNRGIESEETCEMINELVAIEMAMYAEKK